MPPPPHYLPCDSREMTFLCLDSSSSPTSSSILNSPALFNVALPVFWSLDEDKLHRYLTQL